jgi:hypothetical protein
MGVQQGDPSQPIANALVTQAEVKGRQAAAHPSEVAGQPQCGPGLGRPLNQPARGDYHTTRLGAEQQGD